MNIFFDVKSMEYQSITAYKMGLFINVSVATQSLLLTKGSHKRQSHIFCRVQVLPDICGQRLEGPRCLGRRFHPAPGLDLAVRVAV